MDPIEIDGAYREGGGQILRTAVGLSAATGRPCRITNIRRGRPRPGLAAQHVHGVRAVAGLCGARLSGAEAGSTELTFRPGPLAPPAEVHVDVGTAGSVTLVLQGLLIPLAVSGAAVEISVSGGTHVKWSPTADYFQSVTAHFLGLMGLGVDVLEVRPGFYPRGGGTIRVAVRAAELRPIALIDRGEAFAPDARSIATGDLRKARVAERQLEGAAELLALRAGAARYVESPSTGTAIHLTADCETGRLGASALGERGLPAEDVGRRCARELLDALNAEACLDAHMADQILPFMGLARGESRVSVAAATEHCRTNIWTIEKFLPVRFGIDEERGLISCHGVAEAS